MTKRTNIPTLSPLQSNTSEPIIQAAELQTEAMAESSVAQASPEGAATSTPEEKTQEADAESPVAPTASESIATEKSKETNAGSPVTVTPASQASEATSTPEENAPEANAESSVAPASSPSTETPAPKAKAEIYGIPERMKDKDGTFFTWRPPYSVDLEDVKTVQKAVAQATYDHKLRHERRVLPSSTESYGTTRKLFERVKQAIAQQTQLDARNSALCTYSVFSTWFQELLSFAPILAITGWPDEGEAVLRTLRYFCRHGFLVQGPKIADLRSYYFEVATPTFLIYEPNLSKSMASFLACSTRRGFYEYKDGYYFDCFGPKVIYLGENMPVKSMLAHTVHVNASPSPGVASKYAEPLSEDVTVRFQNQLLKYRIEHLTSVHQSEFIVTGLTAESNAIATAFGRCVVDAPDLQSELVELLTPCSDEQIAERVDPHRALAVDAALHLFHQGKNQILVGEIAGEVDRTLAARGERLTYSPEKIGHALKKAGLFSKRLGAAGNGFVLDHAMQVKLHEVAKAYGCAGLEEGQENLHCALCEQNKADAEDV